MITQYDGSGAPEAGVVSPEARREAREDDADAQGAAQHFQREEVVVPPEEGLVAYVAAGEYANATYLIKAGEPVKAPLQAGGTIGIVPLVKRESDVWAKFINGVLVTDKPEVIKWCDEHPTICRRSDDPATKAWATLKDLQTHRANRERLHDPSEMDADASFPAGLTDNLREQAAKPGSPGGRAVESAEITKQSVERERAASDPSVS